MKKFKGNTLETFYQVSKTHSAGLYDFTLRAFLDRQREKGQNGKWEWGLFNPKLRSPFLKITNNLKKNIKLNINSNILYYVILYY